MKNGRLYEEQPACQGPEHGPKAQDQMEMGHNKIGIMQGRVHSDIGQEEACQPTRNK